MPPPEGPSGPSVSVVVVVGGSCVLRYSRPPAPAPAPAPAPIRDGELVLLLRGLGPGAPPEPVAVTSFVGPEPRDLLPAGPELRSPSSAGQGWDMNWDGHRIQPRLPWSCRGARPVRVQSPGRPRRGFRAGAARGGPGPALRLHPGQ
ncbi:translation initiation factor IF-2-like [Catharus ustulatus]|uniref:translation initiation factor IF-2-like n=1 Tax=Catharus ustulatus TaxID=91951 RepID=UPI00140BF13B|nr:translation initiation factor IF-2-like [Catharus ustulatus]